MTRRLRDVPRDRLGYYGLLRHMHYWNDEHPSRPIPSWLWRLYWAFQPLRCALTFHNWYSTAAGLCAACECGASAPYPPRLMHQYRWRPRVRAAVARAEEAEYRAEVIHDAYLRLAGLHPREGDR